MARRARIDIPGVPQHIIQRGNNKASCFFDEQDFKTFLFYLDLAIGKGKCDLHAYVLMTNHFHLLLTGAEPGSGSVMMQSLGRRYVRYFNARHERSGTLWEGRFRSCIVDSERYLLTCYRYIELNPVRAGLVANPSGYRWSSYLHHSGRIEDRLINDHEVFLALGHSPEARIRNYRALIKESLSAFDLEKIRTNTNRGFILGSKKFVDDIESRSGATASPQPLGRPLELGSENN